jgi:hypothetical protein
LTHLVVDGRIGRREGREAVNVTVVHAEGRGDQDRVVDFNVCGTFGARLFDVNVRHLFAALLHLAGNRQQRFQLVRDGRCLRVTLTASTSW